MRRFALLSLLALAPSPLLAQGMLDRFINEVSPQAATHDTSPDALAKQGIFVYDARSGLGNLNPQDLTDGTYLLVPTHTSGEPKAFVPVDGGQSCANTAMILAQVHGGGWSYCYPLSTPSVLEAR